MTESVQGPDPPVYYDLGHQGDFDYTQIAQMLAMTPTERLRHHERWRLFVKEAIAQGDVAIQTTTGSATP